MQTPSMLVSFGSTNDKHNSPATGFVQGSSPVHRLQPGSADGAVRYAWSRIRLDELFERDWVETEGCGVVGTCGCLFPCLQPRRNGRAYLLQSFGTFLRPRWGSRNSSGDWDDRRLLKEAHLEDWILEVEKESSSRMWWGSDVGLVKSTSKFCSGFYH